MLGSPGFTGFIWLWVQTLAHSRSKKRERPMFIHQCSDSIIGWKKHEKTMVFICCLSHPYLRLYSKFLETHGPIPGPTYTAKLMHKHAPTQCPSEPKRLLSGFGWDEVGKNPLQLWPIWCWFGAHSAAPKRGCGKEPQTRSFLVAMHPISRVRKMEPNQ